MRTIPKGNNASVADLVRLAQTYGATFRVNARREVVLRHPRLLPAGLLEKLREHQKVIREHVIEAATSHVWAVLVDGKRTRVIDPARSARAEFEISMQRQFGKARVGKCVRLWPPENMA